MSRLTRHAWIARASDVRLALVHRDHERWLNRPCADLWEEEYAEREAEMAAIWAEMNSRKDRLRQPMREEAA